MQLKSEHGGWGVSAMLGKVQLTFSVDENAGMKDPGNSVSLSLIDVPDFAILSYKPSYNNVIQENHDCLLSSGPLVRIQQGAYSKASGNNRLLALTINMLDDGSARLQTLDNESDLIISEILRTLHKKGSIHILVNTLFNLNGGVQC